MLPPAVEQHLRRAVRTVVAVSIGNEVEFRRRADPDAAEADLQTADQIQVIGEDLAGIEAAVAVGVFEDEDAIARLCLRNPPRVRIGLGDPETAAIVDRHGDRLNDVGLAGEKSDLEARRNGHRPRGLLGRQAGVGVSIERRRSAAVAERPASRRGTGSRRS